MAFKKIDIKGSIFLWIVSIIYTWYLFRTLLMNLGHSMLETYEDAGKNYYTYLYHILYGKGLHFNGMMYPFGENVMFTDNQVILAIPLSYLNSYFHWTINDLLAIMNFIVPLFFFLSILALHKLLTFLKINTYIATLFSLLICSLAPNMFRMFGHFGLFYILNLVLILYFILRHQETNSPKYLIFASFINLFFALFHIYNLAFGAILLLPYAVLFFIFEKRNMKAKFLVIFYCLFASFAGFILTSVLIRISDFVQDRPQNPYGFIEFASPLYKIFTSTFSNLGSTFRLLFNGKVNDNIHEGYAYIGIIAIVYCIFLIMNFILYVSSKFINVEYFKLNIPEKYLVFIGLFSLAMTLGIPFIWNLEFIKDLVPLFKQIRSLSRFALPFYLCISIASVIRIHEIGKLIQTNSMQRISLSFKFIVLFFWSLEIVSYSKTIQPKVDESKKKYHDFFSNFELTSNNSLSLNQDTFHQCLLVLPFNCIGSEKTEINPDNSFFRETLAYSLQTGLPLVNTHLSRSSWKNFFALMRLSSGIFSDKILFSSTLNEKPILVMLFKNKGCTTDELEIIKYGDTILNDEYKTLFRINWKLMMQTNNAMIDSLNTIHITTLKNKEIFYKSFSEFKNQNSFFDNGSQDVSKIDSVIIYEGDFDKRWNIPLEFSMWSLVISNDYRMPYVKFQFIDKNGYIFKNDEISFNKSKDNKGMWFRINYNFTVDTSTVKIKIIYQNEDRHPGLMIDEAQLKIQDEFTMHESQNGNFRLYNNHLIETKPVFHSIDSISLFLPTLTQ